MEGCCSALRLRLDSLDSVGHIESNFQELCSRWFGEINIGPRVGPWIETVPAGSNDPIAQSIREIELRRPIDGSTQLGLRATLLKYRDDVVDLVLVAHHGSVDGAALRAFGRSLVEDAASARSYLAGGGGEGIRNTETPGVFRKGLEAPGFGLHPRTSSAHYPLKGEFDAVLLLAAIGLVLSRFDDTNAPTVGALGHPDRSGLHLGASSSLISELSLPVVETSTVKEFVAAIRDVLAMPVVESGAKPVRADFAGRVLCGAVGVLWDVQREWPDGGRGEYLAFLEPPFPITIEPICDGAGVATIRVVAHPQFEELVEGLGSAISSAYAGIRDASNAGGVACLETIEHISFCDAVQVAKLGSGGGATAPLQGARIEQLIAEIALEQPNATAVVCEAECMTYRELDQLANRIANSLKVSGVRARDTVAVCLERSLHLVPVLLGVMKSGAAYLPIDPEYPPDRIAYMLEDAAPRLVITSEADTERYGDTTVLSVGQLCRSMVSDTVDNLEALQPSDPIYTIYTSGSTGRPKGVVVCHANVVALLSATRDRFDLGPGDVWTFFHSYAFDFSVWEIWGCLSTGGRLVVVPFWTSRSPDDFVQLLSEQRVTVLNQTPSAFALLQHAERQRTDRLSLRLVIFGGEALDVGMLLGWFDRYPETSCRVVNMFGITETTVHVTAETITRRHALARSQIVGSPLPGWAVYILDSRQRMLPPGVAGEIYVGGVGVASHYHGRHDLTSERFLPDPFSVGRMYRSGDRGRLRPDGRLEHLGRIDEQVKIRGFRIELGEIRSALLESENVEAAAVIVRRGQGALAGGDRLAAYVVLSGGNVASIRNEISRKLPDHMIPTLTVVDGIPLTANGKVDVARLPSPNLRAFAVDRHAGAGGLANAKYDDGVAKDLLNIWHEVFGFDVTVDDDFFEIGGNSLAAIRVSRAMRARGMQEISIRELYMRRSIRQIATYLTP